jgi:hypothetical protein
MSFRISSAASFSPHSIKNFGLSGKNVNQIPIAKLEEELKIKKKTCKK